MTISLLLLQVAIVVAILRITSYVWIHIKRDSLKVHGTIKCSCGKELFIVSDQYGNSKQ